MSQLSCKLLETVPPLVSETITDTAFSKEWHAKEVEPEWNEHMKDYELIYYRPILFYSYEGKVSQRGWVGNTDLKENKQLPTDTYKKPHLKVQKSPRSTEQEYAANFVHVEESQSNKACKYVDREEKEEDYSSSYYFGLKKYH